MAQVKITISDLDDQPGRIRIATDFGQDEDDLDVESLTIAQRMAVYLVNLAAATSDYLALYDKNGNSLTDEIEKGKN